MSKKSNHRSDYIGRALIRLEREYGKDELVLSLKSTISSKDVEIGQLKSYIDELEHVNQQLIEKDYNIPENIKRNMLKDPLINQLKNQNKKLSKRLAICRKDREGLITKLNKNGSK